MLPHISKNCRAKLPIVKSRYQSGGNRHRQCIIKNGVVTCWTNNKTNCQTGTNGDKLIYWIRHGQGQHQLGLAVRDPALTDQGLQEAKDLAKSFPLMVEQVQLVVTSPLRRATQTGLEVFKSVINKNGVAIVAHPYLQEIWNEDHDHRDGGREVWDLQRDFPQVNYSVLQQMGNDPLEHKIRLDADKYGDFKFGNKDLPRDIRKKVRDFKSWLRSRPEKVIAITSHWGTMNLFMHDEMIKHPKHKELLHKTEHETNSWQVPNATPFPMIMGKTDSDNRIVLMDELEEGEHWVCVEGGECFMSKHKPLRIDFNCE